MPAQAKRYLKIGKRLKKLRTQHNLSLRDLEALSGVSNCYISQIETGKVQNPTVEVVESLAMAFQVDPGWLAFSSK